MSVEKPIPTSSEILLWMGSGAAAGGSVAIAPAFLSAKNEILESYIKLSEGNDPEALKNFLDLTMSTLDHAQSLILTAAPIGAILAIPLGFLLNHMAHERVMYQRRCVCPPDNKVA